MPMVHSVMSEDIAFRRVMRLARYVEGAAIYMVHVSAAPGVDAIAEARADGLAVYGETLHHYATFTADAYMRPDGVIYHTYPSLKHDEDQRDNAIDLLKNGKSQRQIRVLLAYCLRRGGKTDESVEKRSIAAAVEVLVVGIEQVPEVCLFRGDRRCVVDRLRAVRVVKEPPVAGFGEQQRQPLELDTQTPHPTGMRALQYP